MKVNNDITSLIYENLVGGGSELSFWRVCSILVMSCLIGCYIYFVYKNFSKSEFYSKDLNITMAGMTVIVGAIMIAMQSSLVVSLGMVGALSIVRFRTAIKNPIDLLYLFWSISAGIICGVGLYVLSIILCIIMTFLLFVLGQVPINKAPSLLIINTEVDIECDRVREVLYNNSKYLKQKSLIIKNNNKEWIYEVSLKKPEEVVNTLMNIDGIKSVNWLEYNGEFRG